MSRGNDAIPSWSGFNYQGKITILCALQKINAYPDVSSFTIQLEQREDFVIMEKNKVIELYQVKAVLSCPYHKHYTQGAAIKSDKDDAQDPKSTNVKDTKKYEKSVIEKLIDHRSDTGNTDAKCYLVSAIEISDWNDNTNPFRNTCNLFLYKYNNQFVSLVDVCNNIKSEISQYLTSHTKPCSSYIIDSVYGELCSFLDRKVSTMHLQDSSVRKYNIALNDFKSVIEKAIIVISENHDAMLKESMYQYIASSLQNAISKFCDYYCEDEAECTSECIIHTVAEQFATLKSIEDYIRVINPHILAWSNSGDYVSHASTENIRNHIIRPFYLSKDPEKIYKFDKGIIFISDKSNTSSKRVLPTLLDFGIPNKKSLQRTLQDISDNSSIKSSIAGNTLLVQSSQPIPENWLKNTQINNSWSSSRQVNGSINNLYEDTEIVSENDFFRELIQEDE